MTKKDFITIAAIISLIQDEADRKRIASLAADYLEEANERFKRDVFIDNCLIPKKD